MTPLAISQKPRTPLPVRVVLSDDECLFRASLRQLLSAPASTIKEAYGVDVGAGFDVVGEAGSGEETVRVVRATQPDLLLLDLSMPRLSGLQALCELGECREHLRTILLAGAIDRTQLLTAVRLGVRGLMLKDAAPELLFEAMACVVAGQYWLGQTLVADLMAAMRPLIRSSSETTGPGLLRASARSSRWSRRAIQTRKSLDSARSAKRQSSTI